MNNEEMVLDKYPLLRALEPSDADFMYIVENDPDARAYSDCVAPLSRRILRDYALSYSADPFADGQLRLIIQNPETGQPVGIADLYEISQRNARAFTGIYILPSSRRKGFALKTLLFLKDYVRDTLLLNQIAAKVASSNSPSLALFNMAGFSHVATLPKWLATSRNHFDDILVLSVIFP